ncbi:MAG: N-acetylglucosamine-6-phosphate deacetylase [Trueperaceae bacterium]
MTTLLGNLVTPRGLVYGRLTFSKTIETLDVLGETRDDVFILPGFIDTHVHGGGGGDTMNGPEGVLKLAKFHLQHGTTTLYPTTITNPWETILGALQGVREVMLELLPGLPDIPGVHLEGPFISPKRLGAQPPFTLEPREELLHELLAFNVLSLVTLAPELPGALKAARRFAKAGVRVSIGHSEAAFVQTMACLETARREGGVVGFTHLYNAMGGLSGREPGIVGAALADPSSFIELILDLHHVHPASFLVALRAKPQQLFFITDAIRAAGLPEGETELGGQKVKVTGGKATLADGTLAGSVLTLDKALQHALELGLSLELTSQLLSEIPARYMGLRDRGALSVGCRADIVVLSRDTKLQEVYVVGEQSL